MTLLEVVLAVAIFAAVMGVSAQAMVSFYLSMDIQEQRIEALQSCRAVMSVLRERRDSFQADFPDALASFVDTNNSSGWQNHLADNSTYEQLREHRIEVLLSGLEGAALADNAPVEVLVRAHWLDRRGRPMTAALVTVLNSR